MSTKRIAAPYVYTLESVEPVRNGYIEYDVEVLAEEPDGDANGEIMSRFTNDVDNIDMMLNNTVVSLISGTITLTGTAPSTKAITSAHVASPSCHAHTLILYSSAYFVAPCNIFLISTFFI